MKLLFWFLDINDEVVDGRPEIRLWGLDDRDNRVLVVDRGFTPHFYLLLEDGVDEDRVVKEVEKRAPTAKVEGVFDRRFFGKPVRAVKVTCDDPARTEEYATSMAKIDEVKSHLEDDLRYSSQYLADNEVNPCGWNEVEVEKFEGCLNAKVDAVYLAKSRPKAVEKTDTPNLRVLAFSTVCYSPKGSPKPIRDPVVIISTVTNSGEERQFIAEDRDDREAIEAFVDYLQAFDPDIIAGYGSNASEWPYLLERARRNDLSLLVDRCGNVPHTSVYGHISVTGRSNVDFYDFSDEIPEVKVKTLENVADYLGVSNAEERTFIEEVDIPAHWEDEAKRPTLLKHSLEKARSVMGIAEAMLDFAMQLSNLVALPLDHVGTAAVGFRVESHLIRQAHNLGELVPQRVKRRYFRYRGGLVLEPKPGLHEGVVVLDFKAMYPNIMVAHNISPDTYIEPGEPDPSSGIYVAPEVGHRFRREPPGFFSKVISPLVAARDELRAELKKMDPKSPEYRVLDARQRAVKTTTNACLDYEMPIVVRQNGGISVVQVGELIDGIIDSGDPVIREGFSEFVKPIEKLEVLSFDPDAWVIMWKPIIQGVRHLLDQPMLEIELTSGANIRVTHEHKMYALNETGELTVKRAADVHCGEWLPLLSRIPSSIRDAQPQLNLLRHFVGVEPEITENIMVVIRHPYGKRIKANYVAWHRILAALAKKSPMFIKEIALYADYGNPRSVSRHLKNLKEMGFVREVPYIGRERKKLFELTPDGEDLQKSLVVLSKSILRNSSSRSHYVWFNDVREVIEELPLNIVQNWSVKLYKSRDRLPAILTAINELARLIGYYVAEGTADEFRNKMGCISRRIVWCSRDPEIRNDIIRCFNRAFGFHLEVGPGQITSNSGLVYIIFIHMLKVGRYADEKSIPGFIINGPADVKWDFLQTYDLGDGNKTHPYTRWTTVSPHLRDQLVLLAKQLGIQGISIRRDSGVCRILVHDSLPFRGRRYTGHRMHQSFIVPREVALPLVTKAGSDYDSFRWSDSNISKSLLKQILNRSENNSLTIPEHIRNFLGGELHFEQIVKTRKVEQHGPCVYDLTVEAPHTLFAGVGFIGVSNCYGYAGWIGARWYVRPVAEATAAWGRYIITRTLELAEKVGLEVIYGDTDSVFVKRDPAKTERFLSLVQRELNLEIKPDKVYKRILFTEAKKRYAGLLPDGRLDIVGLEVVRGDWSGAAKRVQEKVLEVVLKEKSPEKAASIVRSSLADLKAKRLPYRDLIIWKTLTKEPKEYKARAPHVEAAKLLLMEGWELSSGDKVGFVVKKGAGKLYQRVAPYAFASYDDLDLEYYEAQQIIPAALRVLSMFNVSEDDLRAKPSMDNFLK